jgi:HAD superfamily hydrolase (TIGR01450 family)
VVGTGLGSCSEPLEQAYDAALLDLDGVLYVGPDAVPHAAPAVTRARRAGMRLAFVTNNASRRPEVVAAHLTSLGIAAEPDDVVTSGQAAVRYVAARLAPGSRVLVIGTEGLAEEVEAGGLRPVRQADDVAAVIQGLATTTSWADLVEAAVAIRSGALWVAGNRDVTYPSPRGPVPGNGAMVAALEAATGLTPVVVGKPEPELHQASVERVGARHPLVVGDRLDTDVLGARTTGTDSLLVLTGVTSEEELLAAPPQLRPTYVGWDLRALSAPQPVVELDASGARCGEARAWWRGDVLVAEGPGDLALRARCALAWGAS